MDAWQLLASALVTNRAESEEGSLRASILFIYLFFPFFTFFSLSCSCFWVSILNKATRRRLSEKVTCDLILKRDERGSDVAIGRKSVPGRGKVKGKGTEAGMCQGQEQQGAVWL